MVFYFKVLADGLDAPPNNPGLVAVGCTDVPLSKSTLSDPVIESQPTPPPQNARKSFWATYARILDSSVYLLESESHDHLPPKTSLTDERIPKATTEFALVAETLLCHTDGDTAKTTDTISLKLIITLHLLSVGVTLCNLNMLCSLACSAKLMILLYSHEVRPDESDQFGTSIQRRQDSEAEVHELLLSNFQKPKCNLTVEGLYHSRDFASDRDPGSGKSFGREAVEICDESDVRTDIYDFSDNLLRESVYDEVSWIFNYRTDTAAHTDVCCYPVARYPDNHNPLLPLSLQKKLGKFQTTTHFRWLFNPCSLAGANFQSGFLSISSMSTGIIKSMYI